MALSGKVALVTGASRGIGKGIALQLAGAGATVYITGRTVTANSASGPGSLTHTVEEINARGGKAIAIGCDHTKDEDVDKVFQQIQKDQGRLDILVNNAFSAVNKIIEIFGKPFWEIPESIWDDINNVALRNHYICSVKAAKIMVKQKSGLIIMVSAWAGNMYCFTPAFGTGKAACDRMAADCALELKSHNVAYISLWPGSVKTENIGANSGEQKPELDEARGETVKLAANAEVHKTWGVGESIEFSGKCIVALATDPKVLEKTGKIFTTAALGYEYNFQDIDGTKIEDENWQLPFLYKK